MKQLIYTDEMKLRFQISYNESWAKAVNAAIDNLKEVVEELSDEQITMFLNSPTALCGELTDKAKKEYDEYMATVPKSVRLASSFSDGGVAAAVMAIFRRMQSSKPIKLIDKTIIKDGVCLLDADGKEALKKECSIYGGEQAAKVWQLSCKAAKALNELVEASKDNSAFADAVECWGRWSGFISITDGTERYRPNPDMLCTLNEK